MTPQSSILEMMGTLFAETIHIMSRCAMHLHGHQNKVVPFIKPFVYLQILVMVLSFIITSTGWLMTLEAIVFYIGLVLSNPNIDNEDLIFLSHIKIDL
jgi:hypothetical protein